MKITHVYIYESSQYYWTNPCIRFGNSEKYLFSNEKYNNYFNKATFSSDSLLTIYEKEKTS